MIKHKIFWNATLIYIMESYILLTHKSLISISNGLGWSSWVSTIQSLFSIFTLTICIFAPALMTLYFKVNYKKFRFKTFKLRFASVTSNLNWRVSYSSNFISIFCYRRLVEVLIILYLS
jgi:hypothetical protein